MELRETVIKNDILESYLFTKSILEQFKNFEETNRYDPIDKKRKNKYTSIIEKIKEICDVNKMFKVKELKIACQMANMSNDIEGLIEDLRNQCIIVKEGGLGEYKLV